MTERGEVFMVKIVVVVVVGHVVVEEVDGLLRGGVRGTKMW